MSIFNVNTLYRGFQNEFKKKKRKKASKKSLTVFKVIYLFWDGEDREKMQ